VRTLVKRVSGLVILPAVLMAGIAKIAPNPDGALVLGLACMFAANYLLSRDPRTR
jgi:hypothetical protein